MIKYLIAVAAVVGATFVGCGPSDDNEEKELLPVITISCDIPVEEHRCFVTVDNAESVEVFHAGFPAWKDTGITEDRVSYIDSPPSGGYKVVACNENGCVDQVVGLVKVGQVTFVK